MFLEGPMSITKEEYFQSVRKLAEEIAANGYFTSTKAVEKYIDNKNFDVIRDALNFIPKKVMKDEFEKIGTTPDSLKWINNDIINYDYLDDVMLVMRISSKINSLETNKDMVRLEKAKAESKTISYLAIINNSKHKNSKDESMPIGYFKKFSKDMKLKIDNRYLDNVSSYFCPRVYNYFKEFQKISQVQVKDIDSDSFSYFGSSLMNMKEAVYGEKGIRGFYVKYISELMNNKKIDFWGKNISSALMNIEHKIDSPEAQMLPIVKNYLTNSYAQTSPEALNEGINMSLKVTYDLVGIVSKGFGLVSDDNDYSILKDLEGSNVALLYTMLSEVGVVGVNNSIFAPQYSKYMSYVAQRLTESTVKGKGKVLTLEEINDNKAFNDKTLSILNLYEYCFGRDKNVAVKIMDKLNENPEANMSQIIDEIEPYIPDIKDQIFTKNLIGANNNVVNEVKSDEKIDEKINDEKTKDVVEGKVEEKIENKEKEIVKETNDADTGKKEYILDNIVYNPIKVSEDLQNFSKEYMNKFQAVDIEKIINDDGVAKRNVDAANGLPKVDSQIDKDEGSNKIVEPLPFKGDNKEGTLTFDPIHKDDNKDNELNDMVTNLPYTPNKDMSKFFKKLQEEQKEKKKSVGADGEKMKKIAETLWKKTEKNNIEIVGETETKNIVVDETKGQKEVEPEKIVVSDERPKDEQFPYTLKKLWGEKPINLNEVEGLKIPNKEQTSTAIVSSSRFGTYEGTLLNMAMKERPIDLPKVENLEVKDIKPIVKENVENGGENIGYPPVNPNNPAWRSNDPDSMVKSQYEKDPIKTHIDTKNIVSKTRLVDGKVNGAIFLSGIKTSLVLGDSITKEIEHYTDSFALLYETHMKDVERICKAKGLNPTEAEKESLEKLIIPEDNHNYTVKELEEEITKRLDSSISKDFDEFYSSLNQAQKDKLFKKVKSEYITRHRSSANARETLASGEQLDVDTKSKCKVTIERADEYKKALCKALGVTEANLMIDPNDLTKIKFSKEAEALLTANQEKVTKAMTRFLIDETVAAKVVAKEAEKTKNINLDPYKTNPNNTQTNNPDQTLNPNNPANPNQENTGDNSSWKYSNISIAGKFASIDSERRAIADAYEWYESMSKSINISTSSSLYSSTANQGGRTTP